MKKEVRNNDAYYTIAWTPLYKYDKYEAGRLMSDLAGIVSLHEKNGDLYENIIFFGCWRDGCRVGMKKLLDPDLSPLKELQKSIDITKLYYRFTVVDTTPSDMADILFWLIKTYGARHNNSEFSDSKRYMSINVKELALGADEVVENIPGRHK